MPITFTDWAYGEIVKYDYDEELDRWDTNVNTMCVGELILNDIILVSARNVSDTEDKSGVAVSFSDKPSTSVSLSDKRLLGWGFDDESIDFDSETFTFDEDGIVDNFTDRSHSTHTFTDWTKT